jgi:hypothetical protein
LKQLLAKNPLLLCAALRHKVFTVCITREA